MSKLTKLINHPVKFVADSKLFGGPKIKTKKKTKKKTQGLSGPLLANAQLKETKAVVYFSATSTSIYQLEQWYKVFEELDESFGFCIVVRDKSVFELLQREKRFTVALCVKLQEVMSFYERNGFELIFYVNNAVKNFQSLIWNKSKHIHINHGESEKSSMFSNQVKAYDYVYVVGQAAKDRYLNNLKLFDERKLIEVGRPQLDGVDDYEKCLTDGLKYVLYAPTWEATHEAMNYCSVAEYGLKIVSGLLESGSYNLIYRPHPSIGRFCEKTLEAHIEICDLIEESDCALMDMETDINAIMSSVDIAIFDNSSVAIDYLAQDKACLMTDFFWRNTELPIPRFVDGGRLIREEEYSIISDVITNELVHDTVSERRKEVKRYYLGNYEEGDSTRKFMEVTKDIMAK